MKVLFISYFYPPVGGTPSHRITKLVKYLSRKGITPIVVTSQIEDTQNEGFYFRMPLDSSLLQDVPGNASVIRVKAASPWSLIAFMKRHSMKRLAEVLFRPDETAGWIVPATAKALEIIKRENVDCVVITAPPFSVTLIGAFIKKLTGVPLIFDMRDLWSQDFRISWPSKLHFLAESKLEGFVLSHADHIVATSQTSAKIFETSFSLDREKVSCITNGFDPEDIPSSPPTTPSSRFTIAHGGSFQVGCPTALNSPPGMRERVSQILDRLRYRNVRLYRLNSSPYWLLKALSRLKGKLRKGRKNVLFIHYGTPQPTCDEMARREGIKKLFIQKGPVPHKKLYQELSRADCLYLPLEKPVDPPHPMPIIPQKFFIYLALKKPILCSAPPGDLRDIASQFSHILTVDPEDHDSLTQALEEMIFSPPEVSIKNEDLKAFSWEYLSDRYKALIKKVAKA